MTSDVTRPAVPGVPVAVVVATRCPGSGAARAVASVLRSGYAPLQVCLIDQSGGPPVSELSDLAASGLLSIVEAPPQGLAAARNLGVRLTSASIVAFTDDDCEVDPGWLDAMVSAFAGDARVGLVFGSVRAAPYDRAAGFIPAYEVRRKQEVRGLRRQARLGGIGASMAVRRTAFDTVHGFDEALGTGSPLCAAEDTDMAARLLIAGFSVCETPEAVVTHFGFRSWQDGPATIGGYMLGLGAAYAKMLRLGGLAALPPLVQLGCRWLARQPLVDLNHLPSRMMRLRAFAQGMWSGWRMPVSPHTSLFDGSDAAEATPPTAWRMR